MSHEFHIIIPARYASSRLPGKPLIDLAGRPMVAHVVDRARACKPLSVTVATDDARIVACCEALDIPVLMTRSDHPSGSDRLAECCDVLNLEAHEVVLNLQGDEPLTPVAAVQRVVELMDDERADAATAAVRISSLEDWMDPNTVKVVMDRDDYALYFSRAPIPWDRDRLMSDLPIMTDTPVWRHVGLYAYRVSTLKAFTGLPCALIEQSEKLEQLRMMYHGYRIRIARLDDGFPAGVDTPEDLERVTHELDKGRIE